MSKNISISDDVYRKLKREKGDRSFSELIEERLERGGKLADVSGERILYRETYAAVKDDVRALSDGTLTRLDDKTH